MTHSKQVIVETPRGSRIKYKLDEETGRIKLSKIMPQGMVFPYDFGFFPGTKSQDGDPLDVLVLCEEPTFPGCQIDCRLAGVLLACQKDKGKSESNRNDRIVAVAQASLLYAGVNDLTDLPTGFVQQIEDFFVSYQKIRGVEVTPLGREGPEVAKRLLQDALVS